MAIVGFRVGRSLSRREQEESALLTRSYEGTEGEGFTALAATVG